MKIVGVAFLAGLAASAAARENHTHFLDPSTNQTVRYFNCDAHHSKASAHFNKTIQALHRHGWQGSHGARATWLQRRAKPIQIQTYFHVISSNASAGKITPSIVKQQLQALNTAYNPSGISFKLINTSYTVNDAWAVAAGSDMDALKQALRVGTYSTLNVYFHTNLTSGLLGTCSFPSQAYPNMDPSLYNFDGCNINAGTMPSGSMTGYNQGKTAVHEVGHWFGLLHTFEGNSCSGSGDYIADTPQESQSTSGCPIKPAKDSCNKIAGVDPIHNYMDYSTDACYNVFTPMQALRMTTLFNQYRAGM